MTMTPTHDELEARIADALTGDGALDASLRDHLAACERCAALAGALQALAADVDAGEPGDAYWRDFGPRLQARLLPEVDAPAGRARARWRRGLRVALPLAAAVAAVALALWAARSRLPGAGSDPEIASDARGTAVGPRDVIPGTGAVTTDGTDAVDAGARGVPATDAAETADAARAVLTAASAENLDAGLTALGLVTLWADDAATTSADGDVGGDAVASAETGAPPPAWGDVLGELEQELAGLDTTSQSALARTLREAT